MKGKQISSKETKKEGVTRANLDVRSKEFRRAMEKESRSEIRLHQVGGNLYWGRW